MDDTRHVTIAVMTFRRPDDISDLLPKLIEQAEDNARTDTVIEVLVVDNDPDGGAREQVLTTASSASVKVRYENETTPGISAARNRALDASGTSDLLIFIDDDERPVEHWLRLLLDTYETTGADAVVGPVISQYVVEPEPWVAAGRFFDRRRLLTGTRIDVAATNNLLLDMARVRSLALRFDLAYGITGGGDTLFTKELHAQGGEMVWCDEAIVYDLVPADRVTRRWVIMRALRSGNSWSRTTVAIADGVLARWSLRLRLSAQGAARMLAGAVRWLFGQLTRRQVDQARGLRAAARGWGMLGGAWGYQYREYRRPQ
ncbi:glycosyltransferase [Aeromicrobium sp.]|uniref:glycosyltransferase family 2 protein n=1 Tax=Aeromicrobium sp. TaxID=1871063 RepID=UPI0019BB94EE|nr:glycosyltransferase [Aeromicrobium sp.]MBC7632675.1 glycosyltransferase family 2 protein [Aeromicrobium sp.]